MKEFKQIQKELKEDLSKHYDKLVNFDYEQKYSGSDSQDDLYEILDRIRHLTEIL